MRYHIHWVTLFIVFHMNSVMLQATNKESREYWNTNTISGKLSEKVSVSMQTEYRFGEGLTKYYYQHSHFEIKAKIFRWLFIAPAYRQVHRRSAEATHEKLAVQHLPQINLTGEAIWQHITFSNRIRIERIHQENSEIAQWRFRNRISLSFPPLPVLGQVSPVIYYEVFYLRERNGWYRSWFLLGLDRKLIKTLFLGLHYKLQTEGNPFKSTHIFETSMQFKF